MPVLPDRITIGELAARSGVASSGLRFYEERGLIAAERTAGNQRVYPRPTLRRVAFIRAAQTVGLTLDEIARALATLPADRTPVKRDWERLSTAWRDRLDERICRSGAIARRSERLHRLRLSLLADLPPPEPGRSHGNVRGWRPLLARRPGGWIRDRPPGGWNPGRSSRTSP